MVAAVSSQCFAPRLFLNGQQTRPSFSVSLLLSFHPPPICRYRIHKISGPPYICHRCLPAPRTIHYRFPSSAPPFLLCFHFTTLYPTSTAHFPSLPLTLRQIPSLFPPTHSLLHISCYPALTPLFVSVLIAQICSLIFRSIEIQNLC